MGDQVKPFLGKLADRLASAAIILGLAALLALANAAEVNTGHSFTNGELVTAASLNDMLGSATINPSFYTGKMSQNSPAAADVLLVYASGVNGFRQVTVNNLLYNNDDLLTSLFTTSDYVRRSNFLAGADLITRSNFLWEVDTSTWSNNLAAFWDYAPGPTNRAAATVDATETYAVPMFGGPVTNYANGTNLNWRYAKWPMFYGTVELPFTYGHTTNIAHGLPGTPQQVRWVLKCASIEIENGFLPGDELEVAGVVAYSTTAGNETWANNAFSAGANETNVWIHCATNINRIGIPFYNVVNTNSAGNHSYLTNANWRLKAYATYWP